jgi:hypothetical protein
MRNRFALSLVFAAVAPLLAGCGGGGSDSSNNVPHPMVRQFSPSMSPIDLNTGQASPTYTDSFLLQTTDPAYPGKIVIFFQSDTQLDPASVFIGGNPALGLDLSALQILQYIPGVGNVPLEAAPNGIEVLADRIIFTPAAIASGAGLPDGQYSIGVFGNLKSIDGDPVQNAPVFHSFTVGATDTIAPTIVITNPVNNAVGIGAGIPAPPPPPGLPASSIADVRTSIFGPTSPDVLIRFNESIDANSVSPNTVIVVDAGAHVTPPPTIPPEPGFPMLKSQYDQSSLPSNGFEIIWRADRVNQGGFPFGTQIQVQVIGSDGGANASPIIDRSGNALANTYTFQFQTIAPPDLPENPFPEYAIYFSTQDSVGVIDTVNFREIALTALGVQTTEIKRNRIPEFSDEIATKQNLGVNFDPTEISVDTRTNGLTGHTFFYVISPNSSQVVICNTRTCLPIAILNTPTPGGISNQTGGGQALNALIVTNQSANTLTSFNIGSFSPGLTQLNGPIYINSVAATGNTPRAVSITGPVTGSYNREFVGGGPGDPIIMYADFADGVVNTTLPNRTTPVKQIALGSEASPNDISLTSCFNFGGPILFAAISEGGFGGDGKVAYYVSGPGCTTGFQSSTRPDSIIGDISGLDAPAGLDMILPSSAAGHLFAVAESGANQVHLLTIQPGTTLPLPATARTLPTGDNPTGIAHRPAWTMPLGLFPPPGHPYRFYQGLGVFAAISPDGSGAVCNDLYICARGAGRVEIVNVNGNKPPPDQATVAVPGIRGVFATTSQ